MSAHRPRLLPPPPPHDERDVADVLRGGLRLGGVLAIVISWSANQSILWAVLHGLCSWLYVIYYGVFL